MEEKTVVMAEDVLTYERFGGQAPCLRCWHRASYLVRRGSRAWGLSCVLHVQDVMHKLQYVKPSPGDEID